MKPKRPHVASLDEVRITRNDGGALIEYADPEVASTDFRLGLRGRDMTDQEILDLFNDNIRAQERLRREYEHVAIEIPPGKPQLEYFEQGGYRTPRGGVLRCVIGHGDDGPVVHIDDLELSWSEFGMALRTYEGWGMRVIFVPDDETHLEPRVEVREPEDEGR